MICKFWCVGTLNARRYTNRVNQTFFHQTPFISHTYLKPINKGSTLQNRLFSKTSALGYLVTTLSLVLLYLFQPAFITQFNDPLLKSHAAKQTPDPDIVVIDIDETSLTLLAEDFGRWPWPRAAHAQLIELLAELQVKHVVLDVIFAEPDIRNRESDAYLAEVLTEFNHVSLAILEQPEWIVKDKVALRHLQMFSESTGAATAKGNYLLPRALPKQVWQGGTINASADRDGIMRRYDVRREFDGWKILSLPAAAAKHQGYELPKQSNYLLNWQGRTAIPHTRYAVHELIYSLNNDVHEVSLEKLKGKWVVIGSSASALFDYKPTPMGHYFPGLSIVTTALDNLINDEWLREAPWYLSLLWAFFGSFLITGFRKKTVYWALFIWSAYAASSYLIAMALLSNSNIYWLWAMPTVACIASMFGTTLIRVLHQQQRRRRAVETFGRFLDPRVVDGLVEEGAGLEHFPNQRKNITVLFSDIRGFTTLSENAEPEEIVSLLNAYFEKQVQVIFKHGGTLDKFIGDAVMAFWGAPDDDPFHAQNAVAAALEMIENLETFKKENSLPNFDIGIGIHTGDAVVAFLGSEQRKDYTVIGDTVNTASRLEGLTKGRCHILVSEQTKQTCEKAFSFEPMGEEKVKGREKPIQIFRPDQLADSGDS